MASTAPSSGIEPREIRVIKVFRDKPPSAWDAQRLFENLDVNALGLDLLEVKAKLKNSPPTLKSSLPPKTAAKTPIIPKPKNTPKQISLSASDSGRPFKGSSEGSPRGSPKGSFRGGTTEDDIAKALAAGSQEEFSEISSGSRSVARSRSKSRSKSSSGEESIEEDFGELASVSESNQEIGEALKEPDVIIEAEPEETENEKKRKIIRRLRTLRKINPNLNIPSEDFTVDDDLELMENTLNEVVMDIKVDQNLTIYKTFMQGYFVGTEFLAGMVDIDMVGFAAAQMKQIRRYDSLLLELAEKNSGGWAANLPVELRLLGLVMINTAVYFAFRYIYKNKGAAQANMFMGVYDSLPSFDGSSPTTSVSAPTSTSPLAVPSASETPKVRGPSINLKDIENELGSTSDDDEVDVEEVEESE